MIVVIMLFFSKARRKETTIFIIIMLVMMIIFGSFLLELFGKNSVVHLVEEVMIQNVDFVIQILFLFLSATQIVT